MSDLVFYLVGLLASIYFLAMGFFQTGNVMFDYNPIVSFIYAGLISLGIIIHIIYKELISNGKNEQE